MFKAIIIASAMAALITGAASMATAGNSGRLANVDNETRLATAKDTHGIVECASQQWPSIDAMCLTPASDEGEIRQARIIEM